MGMTLADQIGFLESLIEDDELPHFSDSYMDGLWPEVLKSLYWLRGLLAKDTHK